MLAPLAAGWKSQLQKLSEEMHVEATTGAAAAREREIIYEFDLAQGREKRQLIIQTSQRQRRSNGQWGKRKPLKLRPGQLDDIEGDDRRILAYLAGGAPERATWVPTQADVQATTSRYALSHSLAEVLLPLMCATRRAVVLGDDGEKSRPLEWDDGLPVGIVPEVARDEAEERWRLSGSLRREDDSISLDETRLVIPGGLVVARGKIARVQDFDAYGWIDMLRTEGAVDVPLEEGHELVDRLLDMPQLPRLELPQELRLADMSRPSPSRTSPCIRRGESAGSMNGSPERWPSSTRERSSAARARKGPSSSANSGAASRAIDRAKRAPGTT